MAISVTALRNAKPREKPYKLTDEKGLFALNTVNGALRRLGYGCDEMTAHGFRAMASTLLNESNKWSPDAIERALAHKDSDKVRASYHRGAHWEERVAMAQWWADYLDQLRREADIVALPVARDG